jgi:UDP-2-acetamido-3-amino-2,3-dideoxy-glucuronate N-acetyltransferase
MSKEMYDSSIHPTAEVAESANIGNGCRIWHQAQICEDVVLGENVIIGKNVYIGPRVVIGALSKIQNNVSIFEGVEIEEGVFIGPHVCFTNDCVPRAINPDGTQKTGNDWKKARTSVCYGASIGAHSVVLPGVQIGRFAMVGAGSVVTNNVPDQALVFGNPARRVGWVCSCGNTLQYFDGNRLCPVCGRTSQSSQFARKEE